MSWSVTCIGKPDAVAAHLDEHAATLTGNCKAEFDGALPHLKALVLQNYVAAKAPAGYVTPVIDLEASGSGHTINGEDTSRNVQVSIKTHYKKLV